ncbi:MAG TPA: hypothetical protein DD979_16015, partial [Gammaproteobacteria bacterium]|nr:hypothetical protein [Gammaproteobacteria bacterium]
DGDYVFVAGTTGYDYSTMTIARDVVAQAEQCFQNIQHALASAGSSLNDIVRVRYLFVAADDFARCAPVLRRYPGDVRPAATVQLTQLLDEKMLLEIEVTARVSGR